MSKEAIHLSPIERELRFSKWCEREGINMFLFDLDDTICSTRQVFTDEMNNAYDYLSQKVPSVPREQWREEIEDANNRLFEEYGVSPNRWNHVVDELKERHNLPREVSDMTRMIFQRIYTTPLVMLDGAEEELSFVKKIDMPIGIVTHAGQKWTWKKFNWLNLERFVNWDDIFMVDENGHKTTESWRDAIGYFGVEAKDCVVIGDSPRSDINPAWEAGVRHCFLVEDPNQWTVHNEAVPTEVKRVSSLAQIQEVVLQEI